MKYFYSHIINIEEVVIELDGLDLSPKEKEHLAKLLDATIHNQILEMVLDEINQSDKDVFLEHLNNERHEEAWMVLKRNSKDSDQKIKKLSEQLKKEFLDDIKEAKKAK